MVQINGSLVSNVQEFIANGDREFLTHLRLSPRDDIECQAVVRYLIQIKQWPFVRESEFDTTLEHLFGAYPDRKALDSKEYQAITFELIKNSFGYECITVVPESAPEKPSNPGKVTRRPRMVKDEEAQEVSSKSSIDTTGASNRLKRIIDIQRDG